MSDIIIFSGSNGKNLELSTLFYEKFNHEHCSSTVIDVVELDIPLYTPLEETRGIPKPIYDIYQRCNDAKGFVFVIPEYNGNVPPAIINVIAWLSRCGGNDWRKCFNAKPAALATFSGGSGFQALISLRNQLSYIGLNVIGRQVRATYKDPLNREDLDAVSELLLKSIG